MKKVGRNDPCPCGSGRKYKKCCLSKDSQAPFAPLERFDVPITNKPASINHHLISTDGGKSWQQKPGTLMARIVCSPLDNINNEIEKIFQTETKNQIVISNLNACKFKLYAVKYHIDNFVAREKSQVQLLKESASAPTGAQIEEKDNIIIF